MKEKENNKREVKEKKSKKARKVRNIDEVAKRMDVRLVSCINA